jgi:N-carbamoylputrescine amidase
VAKVRLALVQMRMEPDPEANLSAALAAIGDAADRGADIVVFPELFRSRYFCQSEDHASFDLAEPIPGESTSAIGALAREREVVVVASIFERRAAGLYHDTAVTIDADGSIAGMYRKMHIPDDPLYYEKFYFTPGDLGFVAHDTRFGRIGTLVCWDQWFPEGARLTALQGAMLLAYPTAIGWHPSEKDTYGPSQADAWRTVHRAHAIANGVYVAAVNRVGFEPAPDAGRGIEFFGGSFVCDPFGVVIVEAGLEPAIVIAELDTELQETVRRHWPFLRDRRIDAYAPITARHLEKK